MPHPPSARTASSCARWRRFWPTLFVCALIALPARGEEARQFRLAAPAAVVESGLIQHILPRFMLKTGRRGEAVGMEGDADAVIRPGAGGVSGARGRAVMQRAGVVYRLELTTQNDAARRFADWLASDIGQNTLVAYTPPNGPPFAAAPRQEAAPEVLIEGDAALGRRVAEAHCARCHRTHPDSTEIGIGSTPSFSGLRSLPDWAGRFEAFYALNPHPSFMRVEGISPDFHVSRPPPIAPVLISPDEAQAILAYVAGLPPADLGAPVAAE